MVDFQRIGRTQQRRRTLCGCSVAPFNGGSIGDGQCAGHIGMRRFNHLPHHIAVIGWIFNRHGLTRTDALIAQQRGCLPLLLWVPSEMFAEFTQSIFIRKIHAP